MSVQRGDYICLRMSQLRMSFADNFFYAVVKENVGTERILVNILEHNGTISRDCVVERQDVCYLVNSQPSIVELKLRGLAL